MLIGGTHQNPGSSTIALNVSSPGGQPFDATRSLTSYQARSKLPHKTMPPSSRGPGYQVLILKTGVRVPLGVVFRQGYFVRFGVPASLVERG